MSTVGVFPIRQVGCLSDFEVLCVVYAMHMFARSCVAASVHSHFANLYLKGGILNGVSTLETNS
jgi:hypothetical protein